MDHFRTGRHVVYRLHSHLVFTTKYRRGAITTDRVRELLKDVLTSVASDMGAEIEAVEADGDHVHILLSYPPHLALSRLVNIMKGVSSRRLRQQNWPEVQHVLWGDHFWSPSYCVVSCGGSPLDIIKSYVEMQNDPERARKGAAIRASKLKRKNEKPKAP
jgi:putative transposase